MSEILLKCPVCQSKNLGKIKAKHYFCRECYSELEMDNKVLKAYAIDVDGGLKAVDKTA